MEMEEAIRGLQSIDMREISEVKSYNTPPRIVFMIYKAICIALGSIRYIRNNRKQWYDKTQWNGIKRHVFSSSAGNLIYVLT